MAPEAITELSYSVKTDAWAYGVTLAEIYTHDAPYPNMQGLAAATQVAAGKLTHPVPPNAPPQIQTVMDRCFAFEAVDRCDFDEILSVLV
jgi:Protein tyrosine and serine/threonine kinase